MLDTIENLDDDAQAAWRRAAEHEAEEEEEEFDADAFLDLVGGWGGEEVAVGVAS